MTEKQARKRLYSHVTRSRFLHVEDALSIGKVRLFAGEYRKGSGASATAHHFLDLDDARPLLADLSWGKKVEFTDYKGTNNGDGPQSRVLKLKSNGDKVWLEIQNGPGEIVGQGAVKPKGKPTAAVSIPLTVWESRKLAHACLAYIRAWETAHLLDFAPTGPVDGDRGCYASDITPGPTRSPAPPVTTPSPVVTQPVNQACPEDDRGMAASVTTDREIPVTATGFWTLYNAEGRAAGVPYPFAQNIANKYGDTGHGWQTAIERLCEAIDEASAKALD